MWQVNIHKFRIGRQAIGLDKKITEKCFYKKRLQDRKTLFKETEKALRQAGAIPEIHTPLQQLHPGRGHNRNEIQEKCAGFPQAI